MADASEMGLKNRMCYAKRGMGIIPLIMIALISNGMTGCDCAQVEAQDAEAVVENLYEPEELMQTTENDLKKGDSNAARVRRDIDMILEIETWLANVETSEFFEAQVDDVIKRMVDEDLEMYGIEIRREEGNLDVPGSLWPTPIGTIRVTGFKQPMIMKVYELHPNSVQRMRVVRGTGTWHVLRPTGWESTTLNATPISDAPFVDKLSSYQIADTTDYHFVETKTSPLGDDFMVVLCWHEAEKVTDVHIPWENDLECDRISPFWRQFQTGK